MLDPSWWRHLRVTLAALERRTRAKALDAGFRFHLALVANGGLTEDSFNSTQEAAKERYFDVLGALRPWEGKGYEDRKTSEFAGYRQDFIDQFDVDPYDERFKQWEAERIAAIEAEDAATVGQLSEEEALLRRLHDRAASQK